MMSRRGETMAEEMNKDEAVKEAEEAVKEKIKDLESKINQ